VNFENPSEAFMAVAQTTSNPPETSNITQAI
jgi:hypothetical protein